MRLNPGEEQFHTYTTWHNGSNLSQPYYQWMTAAYSARGNPQLYFPGSAYIGHEGDAHAWPSDEKGRDLSRYGNNDFGPSKSYHVMNGDNGVFAIWWPETGVGSVHSNAVYDKYGRKIWIWALSREGGIWEDLLTDTDGQYVELQSGRVFNQPRGDTYRTPFKHPTFAPGVTDTFHERWGVVRDTHDLAAACSASNTFVRRPLQAPADFRWDTAYGHYVRGEQALRERDDALAERELEACLRTEANFLPALTLLAELHTRRGRYREAAELCRRALAINTYDPAANYLDGFVAFHSGARDKLSTARERLGLAAYSPTYRAPAYVLIASSHMREGNWDAAVAAAERALLANPLSRDAMLVRIACARRAGRTADAVHLAREALRTWPLFHGAWYELQLLDPLCDLRIHVRNEQPDQTYLELACWYDAAGLETEALQILGYAEHSAMARLHEAAIHSRAGRAESAARALASAVRCPAAGVFPFRHESNVLLAHARQAGAHWKLLYWSAVYLAAQGAESEARAMLEGVKGTPDEAVFYVYRARLREGAERIADLFTAQALAPDDWRIYRDLAEAFEANDTAEGMLLAAEDGLAHASKNNALQMLRAKALVKGGSFREAVDYLATLKILPSEHRDNAHQIWVDAWTALAREASRKGDERGAEACEKRAAEYPENLGAGKPYPKEPAPAEAH